MNWLLVLWILFLLAASCSLGMMWYRNDSAYKYRMALLNQIKLACEDDIRNGRPYYWRYEEFDRVTYHEMVSKFWKRLDSFYPDTSFAKVK